MPLESIFDYFKQYDKETYQVVACNNKAPSESDVAAFESEVGFRLPDEFREFTMSWLGGLYMEVREEFWPRPRELEVAEFWSFLYGLSVFGIADSIPNWLDLRVQYREFAETGYKDLVPFLQIVSDSNMHCFNSKGQIIAWSHDDPDARHIEPLTFSELLMREVRELEQRRADKARQLEDRNRQREERRKQQRDQSRRP